MLRTLAFYIFCISYRRNMRPNEVKSLTLLVTHTLSLRLNFFLYFKILFSSFERIHFWYTKENMSPKRSTDNCQ